MYNWQSLVIAENVSCCRILKRVFVFVIDEVHHEFINVYKTIISMYGILKI